MFAIPPLLAAVFPTRFMTELSKDVLTVWEDVELKTVFTLDSDEEDCWGGGR